ncbi:MAG: hypothetical protein WC269_02545 [Candidatus Gracilibacteria bacterium]|jgi:hypothetical protein
MKIKIKFSEKHIGIIEKFTLVLIGIFFTSFIFAVTTKLGAWGVYLGMLTAGTLIFGGFYYINKGTRLRVITWGMVGTIIFCVIAFVFAFQFISTAFGNLNL